MKQDLQLIGFYLEDDPDGPKIVLVQPYVRPDGTQEEIEHGTLLLLEQTAGPVVGRLAGALLRNPDQAKAGLQKMAGLFRSISRGRRTPRGHRNH